MSIFTMYYFRIQISILRSTKPVFKFKLKISYSNQNFEIQIMFYTIEITIFKFKYQVLNPNSFLRNSKE
jgi:hypothetical protein